MKSNKIFVIVAILSASVFVADAENFLYNVTVVLGRNGGSQQLGRLSVALNGPGIKHNITLSPQPENLMPGMTKSYGAYAPLNIMQVSSVDFAWQAPVRVPSTSWIAVDRVVIVPQYIQDPSFRRVQTKAFKGTFHISSGQRVNFWAKTNP